jgi:hypothetical protein
MLGQRNEVVNAEKKSTTFLWLLIGSAGIIRILFVARLLPDGLFDDAYITFRYAANLARGFGLVFNPGERVLGTTSPLFTFVLAAGGRILGARYIEEIAVAVGILACLGTLVLCERIFTIAGMHSAVKWTFLTVVAFLPSFISNSTSGMETPVVLFLMALSFYLAMETRLLALSIVGFLLFLSRMDTGIWLLALGIHILLSRRGKPMRDLAGPLALFCAATAAWLCFTKIYFGSIVPQSIVGKAVSHGAFVRPDWNYTLTFLSAFVPAQRLGAWGLVVIFGVFLLLVPATLELWRSHAPLRPILYFFLIYVAVFLASHAPLFSWYLIPPKWAFYFIAVYACWRFLSSAIRPRISVHPEQVMALLATFIFGLAVHAVWNQFELPKNNTSVTISDYIEQNLGPEGRIFLEHIGLIGYKTGRYIYDYMGLVTPETTRLKRLYGSAWLTKAAREYDADLVVLYDPDIPAIRSQTDDDAIWFQKTYIHVNDYQLPELVISTFLKKDSSRLVHDVTAKEGLAQ